MCHLALKQEKSTASGRVCMPGSDCYDAKPPVQHVLQSLVELSGAVERLMTFSVRKHSVMLLPRRSV